MPGEDNLPPFWLAILPIVVVIVANLVFTQLIVPRWDTSFLAEPLFRRSDGLASVVDLRVHSRKDFPKSHSAYWELPAVWDAIATAFTWRRTEPLTVRDARRQGFEARKAPAPRTGGA
jgi:hypothetical protein